MGVAVLGGLWVWFWEVCGRGFKLRGNSESR